MKSCKECDVDAGFVMTVCYDCAKREEGKKGGVGRGSDGKEVRLGTLPIL